MGSSLSSSVERCDPVNRILFQPPTDLTGEKGPFAVGDQGNGPVIIFFHGNASTAGRQWSFCSELASSLKVQVVCPEYPGYGTLADQWPPTAEKVEQAARAALAEVLARVPAERVVLYGESMGAAAAMCAAATCDKKLGGVILQCPFTSVWRLAAEMIGSLGAWLCVAERFDNLAAVERVHSATPFLFLHGAKDTLIPPRHSRDLLERAWATGHPAGLRTIEGQDHNMPLCKVVKYIRYFLQDRGLFKTS